MIVRLLRLYSEKVLYQADVHSDNEIHPLGNFKLHTVTQDAPSWKKSTSSEIKPAGYRMWSSNTFIFDCESHAGQKILTKYWLVATASISPTVLFFLRTYVSRPWLNAWLSAISERSAGIVVKHDIMARTSRDILLSFGLTLPDGTPSKTVKGNWEKIVGDREYLSVDRRWLSERAQHAISVQKTSTNQWNMPILPVACKSAIIMSNTDVSYAPLREPWLWINARPSVTSEQSAGIVDSGQATHPGRRRLLGMQVKRELTVQHDQHPGPKRTGDVPAHCLQSKDFEEEAHGESQVILSRALALFTPVTLAATQEAARIVK
ncbi:uncharacterized protein F5891DRAFT_984848 [Suillus fuscotomentosus]|uniref:Uncharacterized protein n=1 Tax=Suillus fuscotomentosus TaxID=1912939 RepID=A0AAD4DW34_9AGAM|nr:uncharacterized protein F5891DRAFT_984848 [Suillus fuscotomentosus]KAG1894692.1 hypothetical protein F5891DRAFT_984848 [Suillus fuscotomentosus]